MKKFLLLICLSLFSLVSFASNIDTLYFQSGKPGSYPLVVDTVKYPYLTEDNVTWYVGFEETNGLCAKTVLPSEIVTVDDVKYLHNENIADSWAPGFNIRTITLFYGHSITKHFGDTEEWHNKDCFENVICDTVAVLHIQKQLTGNDIRFTNPTNGEVFYVGDTVVVTPVVRNNTDSLDVNSLSLFTVNKEDTILLDYCDGVDTLSFIPEVDGEVKLEIGAFNLFGNYVSTFSRTITVLPTLELTSLQSTTVGSTETLTTTYEGVDSMTVSVLEGDSLRLVVNTNSEEADIPVSYQWNVDGQGITADSVYVQGRTLSMSKFKTELQGTYNCIITERDSKKILATASFKVVRQSPTANEMISEATYQVTSENGSIVIKGASNKAITIATMTGKVIYNGTSNSDNFAVSVPLASVLVVKVDNQTFKVLSK